MSVTITLLRHASAAGALAHLDRTALLPLAETFRNFHDKLSSRVVKPLNDIRETVKVMLAVDMPGVVFDAGHGHGHGHSQGYGGGG